MAHYAESTRLTDQQKLALATDRNLSVTAGAGSGKTTILVERFLKILIEEDVDIRHVLAITFTEKAASEMTERVAGKLDELLDAGDYEIAPREKLLELRERMNSAQISTIHGFCARILREFAVASGIDPDFAVITDLPRSLLIDESINEIITRLDEQTLDSEQPVEAWKDLLRRVPIDLISEFFLLMLNNQYEVQRWKQYLEQTDDTDLITRLENQFFEILKTQLDPALIEATLPELVKLVNTQQLNLETLKDKGVQYCDLIQRLQNLELTAESRTSWWQSVLELAQLLTSSGGTPFKQTTSFGKKKELGDISVQIVAMSEFLQPVSSFCQDWFTCVPEQLDLQHLSVLHRLIELGDMVYAIYDQRKEERGVLDFEDLQILALHMLQEHPAVRNTLRNRYRYIMVDEFQDTNSLQWELISLLGTLDDKLQKDKFFIVGDPKQSIYGFRNADVRVFRNVKDEFQEMMAKKSDADGGPSDITLKESFRFVPVVNRFVNHLFSRIMGEESENEFEVPYDHLDTRRPVPESGYIELGFMNRENVEHPELAQEDYIAARIVQLLADGTKIYERGADGETEREIVHGDIAILIPRRTHLLTLESKLRQVGIPFKTIGGVGFYRREEIFDTYHLLRFLANPSDDLAFVALLRSPFAGVSDAALFHLADEKGNSYRQKLANVSDDFKKYPESDRDRLIHFLQLIQRWELRRDRLSLSHLLDEIFNESFYRATVAAEWNGEQLLANIDKIVDMAREFEQSGFSSLADFIESLHQIIRHDPREGEAQIALEDDSTVKIMTIHQAKGLEFPVVFCPYMQQGIRHDSRPLRFDADLGAAIALRNPDNQYKLEKPFLYQWIELRQYQRHIAELKRLFYVAVTRARDRVYLVGDYKTKVREKENCMAWTLNSLHISDESFDAENPIGTLQHPEEIELSDSLTIAIATQVDVPVKNVALHEKVEPGLKQLESVLEEPVKQLDNLPIHLKPVNSLPRHETFSATQLLTFVEDPKKYFRRYHLGFFESDYEFLKLLGDSDNFALLKGNIVHKILELGLPVDRNNTIEKLDQLIFSYEVFDPELQDELKAEIPELIEAFRGSEFANEIFSATDWQTEISLTMQLGEDYFTGTLDRVFLNKDGIYEVVDYKTNRIGPAEVERAGAKYDMQMRSYALLLSKVFPEQQSFPVTLYFLQPKREYRKLFGQDDIAHIENSFVRIISEIRQYYPFGEQTL